MVTSKILERLKKDKRESRNIDLVADMLIIFKFPYNFCYTTSLRVHSECPHSVLRETFTEVKPYQAVLVFGWVTSKYTTCRPKHWTENSI